MPSTEFTLAQALEQLVPELGPVAGVETVDLRTARDRVLAEDVASQVDLPPFDNSAMDGYALRSADLRPGHWLQELGRAYAGHPFAGRVATGTCVRIMTGAPLPDGADTVVMIEDVVVDGGAVSVARPAQPGSHIRRRGEHVARGDPVLRAGRHLRPADLGLAAAAGCATLAVRRRLRVGVLSTGDELADPAQALGPAASYDANRPLLASSLDRLGFDTHDLGICRDSPQDFASALSRARALRLDAVVASGGAALGDADVVRAASGVRFVPLNIRPGRGLAFARLVDGSPPLTLLGLPGNAVAAFVMFHLLARPLLLHLAGGRAAIPTHLPLPLAGEARVRGHRIDYRRATFVRDPDGRRRVQPLRDQGSAMLRTITEADALIALGPQESYADGELVDTVLLDCLD